MARTKKKNGADAAPMTTSQMLGSVLKSARDIMRKDKGLNGDLDRLPLLTWIMFLKFLADHERVAETNAKIAGKQYKSALPKPYRWRDWAAHKDGITGKELISFVDQDEAVRPDGKRGPGLLAYLRALQSTNGDKRRDVISTVFDGVTNRMRIPRKQSRSGTRGRWQPSGCDGFGAGSSGSTDRQRTSTTSGSSARMMSLRVTIPTSRPSAFTIGVPWRFPRTGSFLAILPASSRTVSVSTTVPTSRSMTSTTRCTSKGSTLYSRTM